MKPKENVMDCRKCNWYLCQWCCPISHEEAPSGKILTRLSDKAAQEIADLKEVTGSSCRALGPFATCGAVAGNKKASDAEEIIVSTHRDGSGLATAVAHADSRLVEKAAEDGIDNHGSSLGDTVARDAEEEKEAIVESADLLGLHAEQAAIESDKCDKEQGELSKDLLAIHGGA